MTAEPQSGQGRSISLGDRSLDPEPTIKIAPLLPQLAVPVAVIWGRQGPLQTPNHAERLASDIPGSKLTWVEEASHFPPADKPAPVAAALNRLLHRDLRAR